MKLKLLSVFLVLSILFCYAITTATVAFTVTSKEELKTTIRDILCSCHETYVDGFGQEYIIFNTDTATEQLYKLFQKESK